MIEIAPDGRFEIEVPVDHPSTLSLSIGPRMWDYVYVEPGDTLLCCYDLAEAADPRRARYCRDARFMGHAAPYNAYVRLLADERLALDAARPLCDRAPGAGYAVYLSRSASVVLPAGFRKPVRIQGETVYA